MATRSNIGILNENGSVDYIYCHFDGYPEHNGKILSEHYTTEARVRSLLELGDLSVLGENIGEKQNFDERIKGCCLAYGRDRGESNTEARNIPYRDYTKEHFEEYVYLFTPGKGWEMRAYGTSYWVEVSNVLKQMES